MLNNDKNRRLTDKGSWFQVEPVLRLRRQRVVAAKFPGDSLV